MEDDSAPSDPEIDMAITKDLPPPSFTLTKKSRKCIERLLAHRAEADLDLYVSTRFYTAMADVSHTSPLV